METEVKLTKLASCAGCGAKVGAGTLVKLLDGFRTHSDPRLLVGYDKSDDASVYLLDEHTALVQTTDFFPPIVDDPFLYGQIAAANAISDVYAMGGEPKLALNILCLPESMTREMVQELLRGGYDKAYEAGAIITGGHTIHGAEPIYGLAVSGFVDPRRILTNSGQKIKIDRLNETVLGKSCLCMAFEFSNIGIKPDWFSKIKCIAHFIDCPENFMGTCIIRFVCDGCIPKQMIVFHHFKPDSHSSTFLILLILSCDILLIRRCRFVSYIKSDAEMAAFKDSTCPHIGILI